MRSRTTSNYWTETPRTLGQARDQKALANAEQEAKHAKENAAALEARRLDDERRAFAMQHPQIGELCRAGRPVFYVAPIGGAYRESVDPRDLID